MPTMAPIILSILLATCLPILPTRAVDDDVASYIPITYRIPAKMTECIYEKFDKSDFVTFSVFVLKGLNNGMPMSTITFEGPVAGSDPVRQKAAEKGMVSSAESVEYDGLGEELRSGMDLWRVVKDTDKGVRYDKRVGMINRSLKVDWTHAGESEDAEATRNAIEAEKRAAYRNRAKGAGDGGEGADEAALEKFRTVMQATIEPYEETNAIKAEGWYRLCATGERAGVMAEMDLRSGKELGGVDRTTGHVYTREAWEMLEAERLIEEGINPSEERQLDANTYPSMDEERKKEMENQVREQDLHSTKAQMKHLNIVVMDMRRKHLDYQKRIQSHMANAERNRDGLAFCAKLETLLYVALTGVQVYTVRRWLLGTNVLGS